MNTNDATTDSANFYFRRNTAERSLRIDRPNVGHRQDITLQLIRNVLIMVFELNFELDKKTSN